MTEICGEQRLADNTPLRYVLRLAGSLGALHLGIKT